VVTVVVDSGPEIGVFDRLDCAQPSTGVVLGSVVVDSAALVLLDATALVVPGPLRLVVAGVAGNGFTLCCAESLS